MAKSRRLFAGMIALLFALSSALICCGSQPEVQDSRSATSTMFKAGTYTGEGQGNNGPITVEVVFSENAIKSVRILSHTETPGLSDPAIERIPARIVESQSLKVDVVSGATNCSNGILEAVADCVRQAGGNLEALKTGAISKKPARSLKKTELQTDLLVIGAGGAGLSAANAALQDGVKNVVLIEKQAALAGASSIAGGLAAGDSDLQRSFGLTGDTPEKIFMDIMKGGGFSNDARLTWIFAKSMGKVGDWLVKDMGVPIKTRFSNFPEHSVQRSFSVTGGSANMLKILAEKFTAGGGTLLMETTAESFIMDGKTVAGAVAKGADGNVVNIRAKKTILATGGFGNNPEMLSDSLSIALFYGASASTGEGIRMAEKIGARLQFMDYAKMYPQGIEVKPGFARVATVHDMLTTQATGAIYVNKDGNRVVNENTDFVSIKNVTKQQKDHILFLMMDQQAWDKWSVLANDSDSPAGRFTFEEQERWFNTPDGVPVFRRGTDIVEVARTAGIDGAALKNTVARWNKMVAAGKDEDFGRAQLFPFSTDGKVYIVEQKLRFATTLGGVRVNEGFEVERVDGGTIPGLYAAGECVGGVHGYESMPTCMLSWAVTSGKLAGDSVAKTIK